jgi:predicted nucleic acid-binding protein
VKRYYLDSSAFVKLVVPEPESRALRELLRNRVRVSSMLLRVEVVRAIVRHGQPAVETATRLFGRVELLRVGRALLDHAALVGPSDLRTLDAIHLATATLLGDELGAMVTYDERLGDAARELHMRVVSPR